MRPTRSRCRRTRDGVSDQTVQVNIADDESLGLVVAGSPVSITEGGAAGKFTVKLSHAPGGTVEGDADEDE